MKSINPYLNFPGNAEEAFNFYRTVFGGNYLGDIYRMGSNPGSEHMSDEEKNKIMHIALPMGKRNMIMASDVPESMGVKVSHGNGVYIMIDSESKEEAKTLFDALSEGGIVEMPIADQFWGDYFGSLTDKFGVKWMVIYTTPKQ